MLRDRATASTIGALRDPISATVEGAMIATLKTFGLAARSRGTSD